MRVIFMGTPEFAARTLETLLGSHHTVGAVVTQPDRPKGRSKEPVPSPVKRVALCAGLPVLQPTRATDPSFVEELVRLEPDVIAVTAYGEILRKSVLDVPSRGCVNVHASLLPAYRGAAPVSASIAAGDTETGLTAQLMDEGMDTGDILLQTRIDIEPDETGGELLERMAPLGGELLVAALDGIEAGTVSPAPQNNETASYCSLLKKSDGLIDWSRSAADIHNHVRAMNPWPAAFTDLDGKTVRVWRSRLAPETGCSDVAVGTVVAVDKERIAVATGSGLLNLMELQAAGGKRMAAHPFSLGHRLATGDRFGTQADT
jgi:methionyl-tRNA formyltransferase